MITPPPLNNEKPRTRCTCRGGGIYLGVILVTSILVFMTAAVITYVMPKKYESTAVIQIKPSLSVGGCFGGASSPSSAMTPNFFATQFEVFRSQLTLKMVAQKLKLTTRWGVTEDEAIAILRNIVTAQNIRESDLIEIKVKYTDPEQARDIAKALCEAYKTRRENSQREVAEQEIKDFENAIMAQSDVVEDKRKQFRDVAMQHEAVRDAAPDALLTTKLQEAQKEFETQQEMLERMREKLAMARINLKQPMNLIELHEEPVVAQSPCSPNVPLNLVIGACSGVLLGTLLAAIMRLCQSHCERCSA